MTDRDELEAKLKSADAKKDLMVNSFIGLLIGFMVAGIAKTKKAWQIAAILLIFAVIAAVVLPVIRERWIEKRRKDREKRRKALEKLI